MQRNGRINFDCIAPDAKALLETKDISAKALCELSRMTPKRQAEAARLMVASGCYSTPYVKSLIGGTEGRLMPNPRSRPRMPMKAPTRKAASDEITMIAGQLQNLNNLTGAKMLALLLYCRYAQRLLGNKSVRRYMERTYPQVCEQLQKAVQSYWDSEFIQFGRR
jgi:hypothetical protein